MSQTTDPLVYRYGFNFENGETVFFEARLDPVTLRVEPKKDPVLPSWTALDFHKCEHCPLNTKDHPHCPVAAQIKGVVSHFSWHESIEPVRVSVETPERRYEKDVPLQKGLSSLMGFLIAGSACPHTDFLKPLLRYHLPFATNQESFFRALSMFLLGQYLQGQKSFNTEDAIGELSEKYKNMRIINKGMRERIKSVEAADANANAIMILDCFALDASFRIDQAVFDDLKKLFGALGSKPDTGH